MTYNKLIKNAFVNKDKTFMFFSLPAAAKSLQLCPTLCDPIDSSPPAPRSWDFPGKNTGVGCHFLLQCMKVKSESEDAQLTLPRFGFSSWRHSNPNYGIAREMEK